MHSPQKYYRKIIILILCFILTSVFVYQTPASKVVSKQVPLSQALSNIKGWTSSGLPPLNPSIVEALERRRADLLVQPSDPDGLAQALVRIYDHKRLATELTNTAYQRVTTHYSSKAMALGYLDIYNGLIHKAKPA